MRRVAQITFAPLLPDRGGFVVGGLFFLLLLAALLTLAWMILLPRAVTAGVSRAIGCETTIAQLHVNPFTGRFEANKVRLGNPTGWGEDALAEIPHISGRIALGSLSERTWVVEEAKAEIARVVIIVDADGKTNFEAMGLGPALAALEPREPKRPRYATAGWPEIGEGPSELLIRSLHLRLSRIEVIDRGVQPAQMLADDLEYDYVYENVSRYQQLLTLDLMGRLAKSPALWKILISNGLLDAAGIESGGLQQLWQRAEGAVNSFLQGLEQTGNP